MSLIDLDTMKEVERGLRAINRTSPLRERGGRPETAGGLKSTDKENVRGTHLGGFNDNIRDAFCRFAFDKNKRAFVQDGSGIET